MHPVRNLIRCFPFWMGPFGEEPCRFRERSPEPLSIDLLFDRLDKERTSLARPHQPVNRFDQLLWKLYLDPICCSGHGPHLGYELLNSR